MTDAPSSPDIATLRTFDTTGTIFRRLGNVLTITCENGEIANRVTDQLRSPVEAATPPEGYVLVPTRLTAENGAKAALIGEFFEDYGIQDERGDERWAKVAVTWDTIKQIHKKMVEHFAAQPVDPAQPKQEPELRAALELCEDVLKHVQQTYDCPDSPIINQAREQATAALALSSTDRGGT